MMIVCIMQISGCLVSVCLSVAWLHCHSSVIPESLLSWKFKITALKTRFRGSFAQNDQFS